MQPNQGPQGNELVVQLHGPRGTYGAKHIPALNAAQQLHRLAGANKCVLCAVGWGERMYQLIPRPHSCPATIQFHQRMVPREYAGWQRQHIICNNLNRDTRMTPASAQSNVVGTLLVGQSYHLPSQTVHSHCKTIKPTRQAWHCLVPQAPALQASLAC